MQGLILVEAMHLEEGLFDRSELCRMLDSCDHKLHGLSIDKLVDERTIGQAAFQKYGARYDDADALSVELG